MAGGGEKIEIQADQFGLPLATTEASQLYEKPSVLLKAGDKVEFKAIVKAAGAYQIAFDMAAPGSFLRAPEGKLLIDGVPPENEPQNFVFPVYYQNSTNEFPLDRYENEALIRQVSLVHWGRVPLRDANRSHKYPIQQELTAGEHEFTFTLATESILLGSIYIEAVQPPLDYNHYLESIQGKDTRGESIVIEAEKPTYKNSTSIRPVNNRSTEVTPYDTYRLLLNTMGGDAWKLSGTAVYYEFDAPAEGMYIITLRTLQNFTNNFTVFRRITINGEVAFDELNEILWRGIKGPNVPMPPGLGSEVGCSRIPLRR